MSWSKVFAIINPASGQDDPVLAIMNRAFREEGIIWDARVTHETGDGERLAQHAIKNDYDLVVVYGGDGTVMDVVNGLADTDMPLAVLPGGTGNGVAGALDVPRAIETSLHQVVNRDGRLIDCDTALVNDRRFLLRIDIGNIAEEVDEQQRTEKDRFGLLMYLQAIVQSQLSSEETCFRLTLDGDTIEREGSAFMLMNMSHIGAFRFQITHDVRPDDGLLDVIIVRDEFKALASAAAATLFDDVDFEDVFEHFQVEEIQIETDDPLTILADGENVGTTPATVRVDPATLKLFVPQVEIDVFDDEQSTPG